MITISLTAEEVGQALAKFAADRLPEGKRYMADPRLRVRVDRDGRVKILGCDVECRPRKE